MRLQLDEGPIRVAVSVVEAVERVRQLEEAASHDQVAASETAKDGRSGPVRRRGDVPRLQRALNTISKSTLA